MNSRNEYILIAFNELKTRALEHFPFNEELLAEEEADLMEKWDTLLVNIAQNHINFGFDAQELLSRFIRCYANLTPLIRRELLWFIGGECLHFLGDEEIALFQELEERLHERQSEGVDYDIEAEITLLRKEKGQINAIQH